MHLNRYPYIRKFPNFKGLQKKKAPLTHAQVLECPLLGMNYIRKLAICDYISSEGSLSRAIGKIPLLDNEKLTKACRQSHRSRQKCLFLIH